MSRLLFAYGTLRRGFSRHICLQRLGLPLVGGGTIRADLYDLGEFPGALPAQSPKAHVVGEIYRLTNPERDLRALDRVEGTNATGSGRSLFRRELAEITLANHSVVQAWVYWLNCWRGPKRRIASGDYAKYCGK